MLTRACRNAAHITTGYNAPEDRRAATLAHACCEGGDCECVCHRAEIELTGYAGDPLPVITAYPSNAVPVGER